MLLGPSKFVQVPNPYQKLKQHVKWDGEGVFAATMLLNKIDRASCHNSIHVLETQGRAKDEPVWGVTKLLLHASRDRAVLLGRHPAAFITYNGLIWQCIFRWLFYQLCFLRKFHSSVAEECSNHFWPRDCALADFEVETLLGHEQSWVKGIGNTLETLNLHLQKAPPVDHASNPIQSFPIPLEQSTISLFDFMVLVPRNEVTSREWHYYSKNPSKKLGVLEINWIWSKSQPLSHCQFHERSLPIISFCDEKDVKLTTYNVLSPPLASPQQFPTCNEKVLQFTFGAWMNSMLAASNFQTLALYQPMNDIDSHHNC